MPTRDEILDDRVQLIVADCHDVDERAMAWFYYVAEEISYPFRARCIVEIPSSPLLRDEEVEVQDIASAGACEHTIFVQISWHQRVLAVPLEQLQGIDVNEATQTVIEDWCYWANHGYSF
jgi:hypothetical protein|tara:strand:+ start:185 stop:544 length:360 start_codon:yes stop_codon:yes gene_type:complete